MKPACFPRILRLFIAGLMVFAMFPLSASLRHGIEEEIKRAEKLVNKGDLENADKIYRGLLEEYKSGHEEESLTKALKWGGNVCIRIGRPVDALDFYLSALKLAKKHNDVPNTETTLVNIGIVYALFRDYEQAVAYFEKALPLALANDDNYVTSICHANLAAAYCEIGDIDKAREHLALQKKYPMPDATENSFHLMYNTGLFHRIGNRLDEDIRMQRHALKVLEGKPDKEYLSVGAYLEIAKAYGRVEKYDSVELYLRKSLQNASDNKAPEYMQGIYDEFSRHFRLIGETDSVYKYQTLYYEVSDSQFNNNRFNNAKSKLNRYETDETNRHIGDLKETIGWLAVCTVLVAAIAVILIVHNRKTRKARLLLVKKNQELFKQVETTNALIQGYASRESECGTPDSGESSSARIADQHENMLLLTKIQSIMENLDIISNPDFSLPQLAALADSNTSYVSAVINDTFGKNFKTYLNEYRIHEACRRLSDPQYSRLTIAAIASEVGFKTQNSFIVNFKKVTGVTPSVYRGMAKG